MAYVARLKKKYNEEVAPALMQKFQYKSVMQIPRIDKIVVSLLEQLLLNHHVECGMAVLLVDAVMPFDVPIEIAAEKPIAFKFH